MSKQLRGILLTVIAGIAWGISGISGEYLMTQGMDVTYLLSLRLMISGLFLTGLAAMTSPKTLRDVLRRPRVLLGILIFAIFGLLLNQFAYLLAIAHTNAGTATVLQYISPIMVLGYTCFKDRVAPTVIEVVAIILAIIGTVLLATHGDMTQLSISPQGLFWGLLSAVTYTLYILLPARLMKEWGSLIVIGLGMLMSGLCFMLVMRPLQVDFDYSGMNLLALFGIVGIGTIVAYSLFLQGVAMVGPVNASLLASIEPVAAVFFSITLMQAHFYPLDLLGVALILVAVFLITLKDKLVIGREKTHLKK